MPTAGLPAFANAGSPTNSGALAGAGVSIGPSAGAAAAAGNAAARLTDKEKDALGEGPDVDRLRDKDVGEARSQERRDKQAAEGRNRSAETENEKATADSENAGVGGDSLEQKHEPR